MQRGVEHTPAPWKAVQGNDGEPERWLVVADAERQYHIAVIENGQPGDCLETEGATAHLIAAAPELLDAVKNFIADHWLQQGCKDCSCNVCRMGNDALTKASVQNADISHREQ